MKKITTKNIFIVADVGNTNIDIALFANKKKLLSFKCPANKPNNVLSFLKKEFPAPVSLKNNTLTYLISSVNPPASKMMETKLLKHFPGKVLKVGRDIKIPIKIKLDNPKEAGMDRIINAFYAFKLAKKECVVIDFGTAITFDCISQNGDFLGGIICPGIKLASESLSSKCKLLPTLSSSFTSKVIGKNTIDAMNIGLYHGAVGMINHLLERIIKKIKGNPIVYITGGDSKLLKKYIPRADKYVKQLTVHGIMEAYLDFYEEK